MPWFMKAKYWIQYFNSQLAKNNDTYITIGKVLIMQRWKSLHYWPPMLAFSAEDGQSGLLKNTQHIARCRFKHGKNDRKQQPETHFTALSPG